MPSAVGTARCRNRVAVANARDQVRALAVGLGHPSPARVVRAVGQRAAAADAVRDKAPVALLVLQLRHAAQLDPREVGDGRHEVRVEGRPQVDRVARDREVRRAHRRPRAAREHGSRGKAVDAGLALAAGPLEVQPRHRVGVAGERPDVEQLVHRQLGRQRRRPRREGPGRVAPRLAYGWRAAPAGRRQRHGCRRGPQAGQRQQQRHLEQWSCWWSCMRGRLP